MKPAETINEEIFTIKRANAWTPEIVERRFEEAFVTLSRLPPAVTLGYHNLWPDIRYSKLELLMQKSERYYPKALPEDISKMEETLQWILWADIPERKLIWMRAANVGWKDIVSATRRSRTSLWTQYKQALSSIAERLNREGKAVR
jgi:hypothetical protein